MSFFYDKLFKCILCASVVLFFSVILAVRDVYAPPPPPPAPTYSISAHGRSDYGVNRTSLSPFSYSIGNCAHCHEQHASIGGSEPAPVGGAPSIYALFYTNHVSQTDNFCFKCHTDLSSFQSGGLVNRSYSYRAGGYTSDSLDDILEAFSFVSPGSSHNLDTIETFLNGKWGYATDVNNPCGGCHNPHRAQRDPHTSGSRGWPVSRPSQHSANNNEWGLWGDNISDDSPYDPSAERMSNYTTKYKAPYRFGSNTTYEPDGSATTNGSNLTDYVTFCQDCHSSSMTAYGLSHTPINWETLGGDVSTSGDKHGKNVATTNICVDPPYNATSSCTAVTIGQEKVLSCTDCHEPHGAPNLMLIRKEVNGSILNGTVSIGVKDYGFLCRQCHMDDYEYDSTNGAVNRWEAVHHCAGDYPYDESSCSNCHSGGGAKQVCGGSGGTGPPPAINCRNCHYHGSWVEDPANPNDKTPDYAPTTRRTF